MTDLWRASKSRPVAKISKAPNEQERIKLRHDIIKSDVEWRAFIREKTSSEFKAKSDKYKEIRNKRIPHTCSRKRYARLIDDMDMLDDSSLSSKTPKEKRDLLSKIIGPEKGSYLRAYGKGVTKTKLAIASEKDDHIIRMENNYKELMEKVAVMEQLIHSFMNPKSQSSLSGEQSNAHSPTLSGSVGIQGQRCKLLDWNGYQNIVAYGYFISNDAKDLVLDVPIGPFTMKVGVDFARELDAFLWRPTSGITCIEEIVGSVIAWPADKVIMR
ncbi:uncharacterized protein LOC133807296 isoform X3 [Humulus lupulus]|uniref:uncharacterized protein LOC133807296 isoform X1 n=1 Tax=Humulus lupulus TaxID=3486 RepID=UPI002B4172EC|nr:uncharacterized protein LOC133807296 isoform X1 [Humulus lupulus]XP_062101518.1 uncharacterized protein LOC133807296 isoform X1 [Humulus lupulus]XP_062101519.1 uncharacterized protein LOC133807296 isoform X2 [Humulus lupulus]XP_062101520.1 uncharacterized protein LOC133807296 isoform X3 [Humulus lupulus]